MSFLVFWSEPFFPVGHPLTVVSGGLSPSTTHTWPMSDQSDDSIPLTTFIGSKNSMWSKLDQSESFPGFFFYHMIRMEPLSLAGVVMWSMCLAMRPPYSYWRQLIGKMERKMEIWWHHLKAWIQLSYPLYFWIILTNTFFLISFHWVSVTCKDYLLLCPEKEHSTLLATPPLYPSTIILRKFFLLFQTCGVYKSSHFVGPTFPVTTDWPRNGSWLKSGLSSFHEIPLLLFLPPPLPKELEDEIESIKIIYYFLGKEEYIHIV